MTILPTNRLLYVIGNGFDLYHRIPSGYGDFGRYVANVNPILHRLFENHFTFDGKWADFENTLAHLDVDLILDEASTYLVPYSADDWSDASHHDYQYEIDRIVSSFSDGLKELFTEWVCGLAIPSPSSCQVPLLNLPLHARYLTFNYTNTIQKLYGVFPDQITYIHNQATGLDSDLVLGHGVNPKTIPSLNAGAFLEDQDIRVTQANESIDGYFSITYKPTDKVISEHLEFFDSLLDVGRIYVLGHSLAEVDWPYFSLIAKKTRASAPDWIVSYYDEADISGMMKAFSVFGVLPEKIEYADMTDIRPET